MHRMSRRASNVENRFDTRYSSGDSNKMHGKQCREENNNEVDELSKELSGMGCIVDAVKRPPNICVETCVYEGSDSENEDNKFQTDANDNEEDAYSDEFEEDKTDGEEEVGELEPKFVKSDNINMDKSNGSLKVTRSQASVSTSKPASLSGRSTSYGSVSVPKTRRINMSFTNDRLREIERHNHILLNKILSARNSRKSSIPGWEQSHRRAIPPPAASLRKKTQRQIDHDNLILLKKIQHVKSSACSIRR